MSKDERENRSTNSGFLIGALIGAVAGAVAGILFAPAPGEVSRQKLNRKLKELKKKADLAVEEIEPVVKKAKEAVEPMVEEAKDMAEPVARELNKDVSKIGIVKEAKRRFFKRG